MLTPSGAVLRGAALALGGVLLLAGCGGGDPDARPTPPAVSGSTPPGGTSAASGTPSATTATGSPTESPTASSTAPEVTAPGTALDFGDAAVVQHAAGRRGSTTLALKVRSARRGRLADFAGFDLSDPYKRNAHYYYVRVTVQNVGTGRIGPIEVPLWGVSGANKLLPQVRLTSEFPRCQTEPVPKGFRPGATLRTCLVYLSPDRGTLEGVSYRPTEQFDPIVWTGTVAKPLPRRGASRSPAQSGAE